MKKQSIKEKVQKLEADYGITGTKEGFTNAILQLIKEIVPEKQKSNDFREIIETGSWQTEDSIWGFNACREEILKRLEEI
jgi:hypothetical protein